jgi:protein-S-isoprenylcysteine O-methyltransferase Ste14
VLVLRSILSVLLLPFVVTVVVPYVVVTSRGARPPWSVAPPLGAVALSVGVAVAAAGLALVVVTVRQFAVQGRGTLAPWDPPRRLVVTGVYRHVRNPMISGVVLVLLGEALALRSTGVLEWAATFFVANAIYLPLVEERGLVRRFGDDYVTYRRNVPRWVPRATPWQPPWAEDD